MSELILYISPHGKDDWSGRLDEPNTGRTDGPLATVARARDIVRRWKQSGQLSGAATVYLRGGRYPLTAPLVFCPTDSGPITYAAYPGEQPILDGGQRLKGWRVEQQNERTIWVTDIPAVAAGQWYFRQLFVNDERRNRPRLPKQGFYHMQDVPGLKLVAGGSGHGRGTDTFQAAPGDVRNWRNLTDVDVIAPHTWVSERMPIASFDEETGLVKSSRRSIFSLREAIATRYARYYVENVFEALAEPGEWYLDRGTGRLTYIPVPGETLETAEIYAPRCEQFLKLKGDPETNQYVEYLRFQGITFEHSAWRQPSIGRWGGENHPPEKQYATAPQAAVHIPGVIHLQGARYCAIEDCVIRHVGWYGIELGAGCRGNRIVGNEIADMGAGGVKLDGADATGPRCRRSGNNVITDNHIHTGGRVFHEAVGVLITHAYGNDISHNHIHDLFYSGISCGWEWSFAENVSRDNRITKNHIHNLGQGLLSDMGGVYTLGVQPGTVICGNLIHDIVKYGYGGHAIYLDEGSAHILVENNICYNASTHVFHQNYGRENIVRNNILAFGGQNQVSLSRVEEHNSFTLEKNILVGAGQPIFTVRSRGPIEQHGFSSDLNLLWDIAAETQTAVQVKYDYEQGRWLLLRAFTLHEWRALGNDAHSLIADPFFGDAAAGDFSLRKGSPAFDLGFRAIDVSDVGPQRRS